MQLESREDGERWGYVEGFYWLDYADSESESISQGLVFFSLGGNKLQLKTGDMIVPGW